MDCLNCRAPMVNNEVTTQKSRVSYDMCGNCGSLWLDAGELDKLAFEVEGSIEFCSQDGAAVAGKAAGICPRCDGVDLSFVKFLGDSGIVLRHCRNCGGFFLDGGELNLIDRELTRIMPVEGRGFSDFVNNVHVPYWFRRVMRSSEDTDFHVEAAPVPGASLQRSTTAVCPTCGHNLDLYNLDDGEFLGCPNCKGLWLNRAALNKLKDQSGEHSLHWLNREIDSIGTTASVPGTRTCVECADRKMVSILFGATGVLIDRCSQCKGIWLDRGEFDSIVRYLSENGQAESDHSLAALVNTTIFHHPALFDFLNSLRVIG